MQSQQVILSLPGTVLTHNHHDSRNMHFCYLHFCWRDGGIAHWTADSRQSYESQWGSHSATLFSSASSYWSLHVRTHWNCLLDIGLCFWHRKENTVRTVQRRKILFSGSLKLLQPQQPSVTHYIKVVNLVICLKGKSVHGWQESQQHSFRALWPFLAGIFTS